MKQFSKKGNIESNLELMLDIQREENDQLIIPVFGSVNTGKTSLSLLLEWYLNGGNVNLDTYCLNHEKFIDEYTTRPTEKFIVYEEARMSFDRNKHSHSETREAWDKLQQYRAYNHVVFINFQNAHDFLPDVIKYNAHGCFRTVEKGRAWFYGKNKMRQMWKNDRFQGWNKPDFKDSFKDPAEFVPDIWKEYEQMNIEDLDSRQVEDDVEEDEGLEEHVKTSEFGDIVGVHTNTVRKWCKQGKISSKKLPNGERRIPKSQVEEVLQDG
jgi:hypothetical protein